MLPLREPQVAIMGSIRNRTRCKASVDLIDLLLIELLNILRRELAAIGGGEREIVLHLREVGFARVGITVRRERDPRRLIQSPLDEKRDANQHDQHQNVFSNLLPLP